MASTPNIILCIPSPRDIPQVIESFNNVDNVDKLWVKYYTPEQEAYEEIRNWFIQHKEYTHLTLLADDCLLKPEYIDLLRTGIQKHNFPVLTGFGNVNLTDKAHINTLSFDEIPIERHKRGDSFSSLLRDNDMFSQNGSCNYGIYLKVKWAGFGLTTIKREIVESLVFEDDSRWNGGPLKSGCCMDTAYCYKLNKSKIPIYADSRIKVHHLKYNDASLMDYFYAGVKPHNIIFQSRTR